MPPDHAYSEIGCRLSPGARTQPRKERPSRSAQSGSVTVLTVQPGVARRQVARRLGYADPVCRSPHRGAALQRKRAALRVVTESRSEERPSAPVAET